MVTPDTKIHEDELTCKRETLGECTEYGLRLITDSRSFWKQATKEQFT